MHSFKFIADKHKIVAHRGSCISAAASTASPSSSTASAVGASSALTTKLDKVITKLIDRHVLVHQIELIIPTAASSAPPPPPRLLRSRPFFSHVHASLTSFLSSAFLLSVLASGSLTAVSLSTPLHHCNSFTLANSTITLTLDTDSYQQLGLTASSPHSSSVSSFRTVSIPISTAQWYAGNKQYDRVMQCLSRTQPLHLLVQKLSAGGDCEEVDWDKGGRDITLVRRIEATEEEVWRSEGETVSIADVRAVCSAADSDGQRSRRKGERRVKGSETETMVVELADWFGIVANRLTHLLPSASPSASPSSPSASSSSACVVERPLCCSLPFLPASASSPSALLSLRTTGLFSPSHVRQAVSTALGVLSASAAPPWLCLLVTGWTDSALGFHDSHACDGDGNGENDYGLLLCDDGQYLLLQMVNVADHTH
jgi:hypothetical protein